jgi:hypothetical protein
LNSATSAESTLVAATAGTSISWTMLAAIGIRESAFQNHCCPRQDRVVPRFGESKGVERAKTQVSD